MNRHAARLLPLTAMLLLAAQAAQAETSPWYVGASQAFWCSTARAFRVCS